MNETDSLLPLLPTFLTAYHNLTEPYPVFKDSKSRSLISDEEYGRIERYITEVFLSFAPEKKESFASDDDALRYAVNTYLAPNTLCRAKYCENALKTSFQTGTAQYVILGAGFDTFAIRERSLTEKHKTFEVDRRLTQEDKRRRLARAGESLPENLFFVTADLGKDSLGDKLLLSGFDTKKKTFFSLPGAFYHLYRDDTEKILAEIADTAADGSTLLFDFADQGLFLFEEPRTAAGIEAANKAGMELRSGYDTLSLDMMLSEYGFMIYELLTPPDIQKTLIDPTGDEMKAFGHINYVQAVFKKRSEFFKI